VSDDLLDRVLHAWTLASAFDHADPPAREADIAEAEERLGRELPEQLRRLYRAVGGGELAAAQTFLYPVVPGDGPDAISVATGGDLMRSWDWPIPEELVVFANNGTGDQFGVWLPAGESGARPVIVEVGEIFEEGCMAVVGDDLATFLAGRTAVYVRDVAEGPAREAAFDALGVPAALRAEEWEDADFYARLRWASPRLPHPEPDAYERLLTPAQVDAIARGA
jgi:hypothetical protein